jgi:hypothetical protein
MLKNAIVVCLLIVNSAVLAADKHVTIKGCASAGVENCLFITSPQGRYALHVTPPRPVPGRGIRVTGTISDGPNICMTGPSIKVETWRYTHLHCPK